MNDSTAGRHLWARRVISHTRSNRGTPGVPIMLLIPHFKREARGSNGVLVAIRYYSLECELAAMRGARIPQIAVTLRPDRGESCTESVDPDPATRHWLERLTDGGNVRELLCRLAERYDGRPLGDLAATAIGLLPAEVGRA